MAKFEKRIEAHKLRKQGKSIKAIAETLSVSKSSVSVWCRDVGLTTKQKERLTKNMILAGHQGRMKGAQRNKRNKELRIEQAEHKARKTLGKLSKRDRFMLGLGLYWGEGVKADQSMTAFVNSDPVAISFMKEWFCEFFHIGTGRFSPYVFIASVHKEREEVIRQFWSRSLQLPQDQFKIVYLKSTPKKVYDNHNMYYGTLALRVRSSTDLKYEIRGLIKYILPT